MAKSPGRSSVSFTNIVFVFIKLPKMPASSQDSSIETKEGGKPPSFALHALLRKINSL
jgi:hypothetical protein